jgi:hypothetical protein
MLSLLDAPRTAPATGGINWDALTAIGTLALAVVTLLTLAYAIWTTRRERRQAASDREDAEKRLEAERMAGDQRLRSQQDHEAKMRRRDRQIANVAALVARVADIRAHLSDVPGIYSRAGFASIGTSITAHHPSDPETLAAISSLEHGAWAEAAMLGTSEAAEKAAGRYRTLARLVDEAASEFSSAYDRDLKSLRNYARWVLLSLRMLAEDETVPPFSEGAPPYPMLGLGDGMPVWRPDPIPVRWDAPEVDVPVPVSSGFRVRRAGASGSPAADSDD